MKMTTEEAFVKVLQMHGIEHAFGIIGSAMMPISDLFPAAGIKFWDGAHEGNAGMTADGYSRVTGKMSMAIAQNGPGITNFVTPIKTAYWNHTPLLLVTPQAANKTIEQGGFQEIKQMALFADIVCYQEEVRDPSRIAEVLNRVIEKAWRGSAPAQINVPRDFWTQVIDIELPRVVRLERARGGEIAIAEAAKLLSNARFPVILNGAGVVLSGGIEASKQLAEQLDAPVCCNYQHNDAFPGSPLAAGPLGYNGSKAAMQLIAKRCGVGAGHATQYVLYPARLWHRLLAERCQDHPGRHQRRPHRPDQESRCGHPGRCAARGRADFRATAGERRQYGPRRSPRTN
jgi:sulfoacetaldehyde acetyltransferase